MSGLTNRQEAMLARGLAEFDGVQTRRRRRRRALGGAVAACATIVAAVIAVQALTPPHATSDDEPRQVAVGLPAYVEIIRDDWQLTAELELANACERIGREGGRLFIVECMRPQGR
jgi:hypothetical protein